MTIFFCGHEIFISKTFRYLESIVQGDVDEDTDKEWMCEMESILIKILCTPSLAKLVNPDMNWSTWILPTLVDFIPIDF